MSIHECNLFFVYISALSRYCCIKPMSKVSPDYFITCIVLPPADSKCMLRVIMSASRWRNGTFKKVNSKVNTDLL